MLRIFKKLKSLWTFSESAPNLNEGVNPKDISDAVQLEWSDSSQSIKCNQAKNSDEALLSQILNQWDPAQWSSLFEAGRGQLQGHPDRAKLAILACSGLIKIGRNGDARQLLRLARGWGGDTDLISRALIADVHNTLGRAASIIGNRPRAMWHAEHAISLEKPHGNMSKLESSQHAQNISTIPESNWVNFDRKRVTSDSRKKYHFSPELVATHSLGKGWASNTVNTVIFRHHGVLTWGRQQYLAFFVDENTLHLVQRNLDTEEISTHRLYGKYNLIDAHNSISLGIDRSGCLHISYDQHATKLNYRRALLPNSITQWTDEISMTGQREGSVTYPTFILPRKDFPLSILYRDGSHDKGSACLKSYDEESRCWTDFLQPILSGVDQRPWTSNAYWNHPAIGNDGSLHLSFVWRSRPIGNESLVNNKDISYAFSPDNGETWFTSHNQNYLLPITQVNAEIIHPVSPGSNLINQCSMAVDSKNRPHIVFYSDDRDGILQYQHLRFDGKEWHHQNISSRQHAFKLKGRGTLRIPISRPDIVIDENDNAFIIYRGDLTEDRMVATALPAPDYVYRAENTKELWDENLGFAEPVIDRQRWRVDGILSILVQNNEQPDEDKEHEIILSPVSLLDFRFVLSEADE